MRKGLRARGFLAGLILFFWIGLVSAYAQAYSYGPACQWLRLRGQVVLPSQDSVKKPLLFSATYQLPGMDHPATLLTNYPLGEPNFYFILAGYREKIGRAIFVPPMFFFAKEIVFRFYAKSADGKWASEFGQKVYEPQNIPIMDIPANRDKEYQCQTDLQLGKLVLSRVSR